MTGEPIDAVLLEGERTDLRRRRYLIASTVVRRVSLSAAFSTASKRKSQNCRSMSV
jgi:hypothetical protein